MSRPPLLSRRVRPLLVGLAILATSFSTVEPAIAYGGNGGGSGGCESVNNQATCVSGVHFQFSGSDRSGTTTTSSDLPPLLGCWYEPSFFTPGILKALYAIPFVGIVVPVLTYGDIGNNGDFHDGQKGRWWEFVYNPAMSVAEAKTQCGMPPVPTLEWVPNADPPAQQDVSAFKMAAAAAKMVHVTKPTLALRPVAGNQVVNLPTLVSFQNAIKRTWVTATLNVNGYSLAATTIATPASVTVNAGTADASPSSCTYTLAPSGTDYQIDPTSTRCSDGSSGPNAGIIYRRPNAPGTHYQITATVTWNVTWTDTDSPDSPPQTSQTLGPLTLTTVPVPVTVKEVESVNK